MAESNKSKKMGRNAKKCERYKVMHKRERNKASRLLKHIKMHVHDVTALAALKLIRREYPSFVKGWTP